MKIIVTERQLEILRLIKENEDDITKIKSMFVPTFNDINKELNRLYNKIQFINVGELLNGETNVEELLGDVNRLETSNNKTEDDIDDFFNNMDEKTYYDNKMDELKYDLIVNYHSNNNDKINVISSILISLEELAKESINNNHKKVFTDNKDINVG